MLNTLDPSIFQAKQNYRLTIKIIQSQAVINLILSNNFAGGWDLPRDLAIQAGFGFLQQEMYFDPTHFFFGISILVDKRMKSGRSKDSS
jgi:hypothetical protein